MISQTAEYALRAVVHLAENKGVACISREMASATQVPHEYLSKTLQALQRAGIVRGRRGLHGGFVLALPAAELRVLDVVSAIDPARRIRHCPLNRAEHGQLCPLHKRLDEAAALVEASFRNTTIAELMQPPGGAGWGGVCRCSFPDRRASVAGLVSAEPTVLNTEVSTPSHRARTACGAVRDRSGAARADAEPSEPLKRERTDTH